MSAQDRIMFYGRQMELDIGVWTIRCNVCGKKDQGPLKGREGGESVMRAESVVSAYSCGVVSPGIWCNGHGKVIPRILI